MLKTALLAVLALAVAIGGGAAGAWLVLNSHPHERIGWTPSGDIREPLLQGSPELRRPLALPLGRNEGASFVATLDDAGRPLRAACDYRIAGRFPPSRLWTLVTTDRGNPKTTSSLHSLETLREPDGSDAVTVSRRPSPGNWLAVGAGGSFSLSLSLYGSAVNDGTGFSDLQLPRIETLRCDE